jgi:toxin FitB
MYILDTNVVSELRKTKSGRANPNVVSWISARDADLFFISAITVLELEYGTLLMERRDARQGAELKHWLQTTVYDAFDGRILPVTGSVAQQCAALHIPKPRPERDCMIAATAMVYGFEMVTRNLRDFEGTAIGLIDPWA